MIRSGLKRAVRWVYRSAVTGRFVTRGQAERAPTRTVRERRTPPRAR